jgi:hypothetical protein
MVTTSTFVSRGRGRRNMRAIVAAGAVSMVAVAGAVNAVPAVASTVVAASSVQRTMTVNGAPDVSVPAGFSGQVVPVLPPSGATPATNQSDGKTSYSLPAGTNSIQFNLPTSGSPIPQTIQATAVSTPTSATTPSAAATPAGQPGCLLRAVTPSSAGTGRVQAYSQNSCSGPGVSRTTVTSTLYWSGSNGWVDQGNQGGVGVLFADATFYHSCTSGEVHAWHTRADGTVTNYGVLYSLSGGVNSSNVLIACP